MNKVEIKTGKALHEVSPLLYGLFLEDINFTCDGGMNANRIANHSFDGVYIEGSYDNMLDGIYQRLEPDVYPERLRYWEVDGGTIFSMEEDGFSKNNPWYARLSISGKCTVINKGFNGRQKNKEKCAISIETDHEYEFSGYFRTMDYSGTILISIEDENGNPLTDEQQIKISKEWSRINCNIYGKKNDYGCLKIEFTGNGTLDMDCIVFMDTDTWGKDDAKWSGGHLRKDMVEVLKEMNPSFLRFPGGCIVEGIFQGNEYQWKNTIGTIEERIPNVSYWGAAVEDKGYCQSNQVGFYEYFLMCEDLKMEPLPVVWAGITCQFK